MDDCEIVFDLRGNRCEVAAWCDQAEIENLAFSPTGEPVYTGDRRYKSIRFLVDPRPERNTKKLNISALRFGLA